MAQIVRDGDVSPPKRPQEPQDIDPAHLPAVLEGLAQAKAGRYASIADVEAAFRRFDR